MDISEIPVLTRVVHKTAAPAVDMDDLLLQVKQALLPDIAQLVSEQLAARAPEMLVTEQQALAAYAQDLQQTLLSKAQSQVGDSIQSIEDAFKSAMEQAGQQQLQQFETQVSQLTNAQLQSGEQSFVGVLEDKTQQQLQVLENQLNQLHETQQQVLTTTEQTVRDTVEQASGQWLHETLSPLVDAQQAQMESRLQSLREQLEQQLVEHMQQLQENSKQALAISHEVAASSLVADYKQSLHQVFSELNSLHIEEFKQRMQSEISAASPVFEEKVAAVASTVLASQWQAMEADLNKRLKARILEVLQGIKFVMPTL